MSTFEDNDSSDLFRANPDDFSNYSPKQQQILKDAVHALQSQPNNNNSSLETLLPLIMNRMRQNPKITIEEMIAFLLTMKNQNQLASF